MKIQIWIIAILFQFNFNSYSQLTLNNSLECNYKIIKKRKSNLQLRIIKKNVSTKDTILTYSFSIWKQLAKTVDSEYSNSLALFNYNKHYYDVLLDYEFGCHNGIYDPTSVDTLKYEGATGSGIDWSKRNLIVLPPGKKISFKIKIRRNVVLREQKVNIIDRHIKLQDVDSKNIENISKSTIAIYCIREKLIQKGDSSIVILW